MFLADPSFATACHESSVSLRGKATLDDLSLKMDRTPGGNGSYETAELVERFTLDGDGLAQETLEYDRAGNLTYDGVFKYQYDAWNRMTRVTKAYRDDAGAVQTGSVLQENEYDGLGRRVVVRITNSGDLDCTQHLYYDGWSLVEVRNGSDITTSQYVWAGRVGGYIDELVQIAHNLDWPTTLDDTCETAYWAMQDANYNVLGVVDDTGKLVERYDYEPYGERRVYVSAGSNDPLATASIDRSQRLTLSDGSTAAHGLNAFGHQGLQHRDVDAGIDNRRRTIGGFTSSYLQRDPLTYVDGSLLYARYSILRSGLDPYGTELSPVVSGRIRLGENHEDAANYWIDEHELEGFRFIVKTGAGINDVDIGVDVDNQYEEVAEEAKDFAKKTLRLGKTRVRAYSIVGLPSAGAGYLFVFWIKIELHFSATFRYQWFGPTGPCSGAHTHDLEESEGGFQLAYQSPPKLDDQGFYDLALEGDQAAVVAMAKKARDQAIATAASTTREAALRSVVERWLREKYQERP